MLSGIAQGMDNEKEIMTEFLCNSIHNGQFYIIFSKPDVEYNKTAVQKEIIESVNYYMTLAEKCGEVGFLVSLNHFLMEIICAKMFSQEFKILVNETLNRINIAIEREMQKETLNNGLESEMSTEYAKGKLQKEINNIREFQVTNCTTDLDEENED